MAGWRTVRVFISSTFRDMQAERDYLVRFVFPRLREELLKRRVHLVDVDLRWGVTAEEDALEVCREIIDECRPRFICMLGGRYGWTPPGEERSITADEVYYAALDRLDADEYRHFYFRDPAATASIPEGAARAGGYREFPGDDETEEIARERSRKLAALKQRVREAGLPVFDYPCEWDESRQRLIGLEEFGEAVYRDLLASVDDELGEEPPEALDWFAEENASMEAFVEDRTERYVVGSRQPLVDEMTAHAEGVGEPSLLVVTGEPGSGKSALLGRFYRDYVMTHPDEIVIPHFVGASQGSTSIRQTLRRLCHELAQATGVEDEIPEDIKELVQAFLEFLERAAGGKRVVIVIDALNQLDATDNAHALNWLPRELPEGVRVVCSSLAHAALEALRRRTDQVRETVCGPLTADDAETIVDAALALYHKRFDDAQRSALLSKADAGSPLYLLAALEELRTLGTYELITARIADLPGTVTELFDWILRRLAEGVEGQEAFGEDLVSAYTSYIAIGRGGMAEGELEALCAPVDDEDEFWVLDRMLRPYLMHRGELMDYFHDQLREAVERRYLSDDSTRQQRHREIAPHLQGRGYEYVRTLSELPYHLTHGAMSEELAKPLTDLTFIEKKCAAGMTHELVQDYNRIGAGRGQPGPPIRTARRHDDRLGIWCPFCLAWSGVSEEDLNSVIVCPDCGSRLKLNAFVVDAEWRPAPRRRDAPEDETRTGAQVSSALHEFADFVRSQAHVLAARSRLVMQQALNWSDDSAPAQEARRVPERERGPVMRWLNTPLGLDPCLTTMEGHERPVETCALSPDGTQVVSGADDGTMKVWDAHSGLERLVLAGHDAGVDACCFAPDGTRIVSGAEDGTLRVWDARSGDGLLSLDAHGDRVNSCGVSPDGARIVSGGEDGTLRLWDAQTGEELAMLRSKGDAVSACSFSPDGRWVLWGCRDCTLNVCDAATGQERLVVEVHRMPVNACAFSPLGDRIVSASYDEPVMVSDAESGRLLVTLEADRLGLSACRFSPDGARIVAASMESEVLVWDAQTGARQVVLVGHDDYVRACGFAPDARRIVSASWDHTVKIWDAQATGGGFRQEGHRETASACGFSPDGLRIISGGGVLSGEVVVWDARTGTRQLALEGLNQRVNDCRFSPDGRRIVTGGGYHEEPGELRVWDADSGAALLALEGHRYQVRACGFSPDGSRIVSAGGYFSDSGELMVWSAETGERQLTLSTGGHEVRACDFSPDGGRIASVSGDQSLMVWDAATGEEQLRASMPGMDLGACSFSPDGEWITVGETHLGERSELGVWDARSGERQLALVGHSEYVSTCGFCPDGRYIVSGAQDRTLRLWDADSGREVGAFHARSGLSCAAASGDGRYLVAVDRSGGLYRLRLEGLDVGPPILTGVRMWLFDRHGWDRRPSAMCPFHGGRFEVTEMMIGEEVPCPECGEPLKINEIVCDGTPKKPWWRFW